MEKLRTALLRESMLQVRYDMDRTPLIEEQESRIDISSFADGPNPSEKIRREGFYAQRESPKQGQFALKKQAQTSRLDMAGFRAFHGNQLGEDELKRRIEYEEQKYFQNSQVNKQLLGDLMNGNQRRISIFDQSKDLQDVTKHFQFKGDNSCVDISDENY